jgi:hypothetical protein
MRPVPYKPAMAGIHLPAAPHPLEGGGAASKACTAVHLFHHRPEIGRGYPLNLSISLSGGKETNQDSLSNGE